MTLTVPFANTVFFFQGAALVWESYKLDPYVNKFAETIGNFQEKMEDLLLLDEQIAVQLKALDTTRYSATTIKQIMETIQKAVDSLSLHQYSNLTFWVQRLDEEVNICFFLLSLKLAEGVMNCKVLKTRSKESNISKC